MIGRRSRRPRGRLAECRDCADPIVFVQLDNGTRLPVNPLPSPAGNVAARLIGGGLHGYVIYAGHPYRPDHERMMPHAATCKSRPARTPAAAPAPDVPDDPLF